MTIGILLTLCSLLLGLQTFIGHFLQVLLIRILNHLVIILLPHITPILANLLLLVQSMSGVKLRSQIGQVLILIFIHNIIFRRWLFLMLRGFR